MVDPLFSPFNSYVWCFGNFDYGNGFYSVFPLSNLKDELDDDVLHSVMQLTHPNKALFKARELKEKRNVNFGKGIYLLVFNLYGIAFQFICVGLPFCEEEALLIYDLIISHGLYGVLSN